MSKIKLKGWCFQNKETGELEPMENGGKNWDDRYGIWGTKKDLLNNYWGNTPEGYEAVKISIEITNLK